KNKATVTVRSLPVIEADPTQMWQLFQNLIKNAIKFKREGNDPKVEVYADKLMRNDRLRATPGDTLFRIYVRDNGIGFDNQYAEKIFQIFQRLEGRKYEGSGIGLAVCKRIANRHGGDIEAKGVVGAGATFIVSIAASQPREEVQIPVNI
ncbi:MAG: ATP-binding protein, partial [Bacteroidota bacterium]